MAKTLISIKADTDVKEKAQRVARDLGMPLSTIVNAYLGQLIRTREVHFTLEGQLKPSVKRRLDRLTKEVKEGKSLSLSFSNAEDAIRYLNS